MHSERTNGALRDILHHINLATQFVEGFDRETFKLDLRRRATSIAMTTKMLLLKLYGTPCNTLCRR
jgi:uncharacterized protein with HEPN domain